MKKPLIVRHKGRAGNRLFQYFFCAELARRAGNHEVVGVHIPDLDIDIGWGAAEPDQLFHIEGTHEFDLEGLASTLRHGDHAGASFRGFAMRLEYFDRAFCRQLLNLKPVGGLGFGPEYLTINIRGGDIFAGPQSDLTAQGYGRLYGTDHLYKAIHPDYRPLPLAYYETLLKETGLKPVFVGETGTHQAYEEALHDRFPNAVFTGARAAKEDFLTLMGSSHIALAISSFSWIAAWLSEARSIHIPVAGLFDPEQRPDIHLLPPPSDTRYIRHALPRLQWLGTPEQIAALYA